MSIIIPKLISGSVLKQYMQEHTRPISEDEWCKEGGDSLLWKRGCARNFVTVTDTLYVFKKTQNDRLSCDRRQMITNLIIPVGAIIHIPYDAYTCKESDSRKMRTNKAIVHSNVMCTNMHHFGHISPSEFSKQKLERWTQRAVAHSQYLNEFTYKVDHLVKPRQAFSLVTGSCESGIHFFVNVVDALKYGG